MTNFTPATALIGGALIGAASVLLWALNGRIAGVSGIAAGLVSGSGSGRGWRLLFLVGLVLGAGLWVHGVGAVPAARPQFPTAAVVVAGLLVGYGTALAGGCTSGHGVCGLARGAWRSLVATAVFLAVALATTAFVRHGLQLA